MLFTLGSWEIHGVLDSEWVEIFHICQPYAPIGDVLAYSYQNQDDTDCPGCGETQPDEIQALEQMHNMDRPAQQYSQSLAEMLREDYEQMFTKVEKKMFLRGSGVNE